MDFVFSVDVVHHVRDLAAACTELARVLRSGGRTCIVTDDEASIRSRLHARYFPESVAVELDRYPTIAELRAALAGFTGIAEQRTESAYRVRDATPYAEKAFSSLHLIADDAHRAGIERLERDLERGPVEAVSRAVLVWATKP
jgi:SAM-dependent methyltransferase